VGGWTQRRGRFVHLLLGVRKGRRRKLTFVGEVETPPDDLAMNFLEDQLRSAEVENSPFDSELPVPDTATSHWTAPELVAEVGFSGWTKSHTLSHPSLRWVTQRTAVRHAHWLSPPE
jgi:bifunctional non-homologous end joining protein LigD